MLKTVCILILVSWNLSLRGQSSVEKIKADYDSLIRTTIYGKNPKAGKFYDIRGFKMYCETYGTGEPLLLIHGNGASIHDFVKQIPYFSKHFKVIVADSRGHGKSIDKSDSLTYEMMADDYDALLSAMHIDSANVIGWSDGGINGLLLALRHPGKVRRLVITGANLRPDSTAVSGDILKRMWKTYNMFDKMFAETRDKTPLDSMIFKYLNLVIKQPNIPSASLHAISIPTLVIGGDHDVIRPSHTVEIFQNIPNASLWILPNSGHSTLIVYTDEFNKKAENFLRQKYRKIEGKDREF